MAAQHFNSPSFVVVKIPYVTFLLIALNVVWFGYFSRSSVDGDINHATLIHLGANVAELTLTGESWRLVASLFLQGSFSHLFLNMLALAVIGAVAERLLGRWRLLVVYLLSGSFGSLVSACYALSDRGTGGETVIHFLSLAPQVIISIGASGAIMGLAGASIVALVFADPAARSENDRRVLYSTLGMVVLTLLYGTQQEVDNASHIGGLCAGAVIGFAIVLIQMGSSKKLLLDAFLFCGCCALLLGGTWLAQRQIDESDLEVRASLRDEFYPLSVEKERQLRRKVLADEREKHMTRLPEPVSNEEARGTTLAEIPDINDIALSKDGKTLYAAVEDNNTITVYSLEQHKILRTFTGTVRAANYKGRCSDCGDRGVRALKLSLDETRLYATGFEPDSLSVIRVATGEVIQTIATGRSPDAMVVSRDGKRTWVMNRTSNTISAIDLTSYQPIGDIPLGTYDGAGKSGGSNIRPIALSSDEKTLLVPDMGRSDIVRIDTSTHQKVDYPAGDTQGTTSVVGFRPETGEVIFADSLGISRIGQTSQQPKLLAQWCSRSIYSAEAMSPDGRYIALSTYGLEGYIVLLSVDASQVVGGYPASRARQVRFSADGKQIYVLGAKALTVLDRDKSLAPRELVRHPQYGDVACLPDVD